MGGSAALEVADGQRPVKIHLELGEALAAPQVRSSVAFVAWGWVAHAALCAALGIAGETVSKAVGTVSNAVGTVSNTVGTVSNAVATNRRGPNEGARIVGELPQKRGFGHGVLLQPPSATSYARRL